MRKPLLSLFAGVPAARVLCLAAAGALLAGALPSLAGAETCPNAEFRSGLSANLPDCRAYEMVTPPYKDGYFVNSPVVYEGENGLSVTAKSLGVFAGAENDTALGNVYDFTRTASGWKAASLTPPASQFPQVGNNHLTSPDGSTLWDLGQQPGDVVASEGEGELIYIKKPDGALVEVGPILSPSVARGQFLSHIEGASRDFSTVVFAIDNPPLEFLPNDLWPFDTTSPSATNESSQYEYVGTGNSQPVLVAVSGGAGSTDLISKCGSKLGSHQNLEGDYGFNPISADGSIVFFTPVSGITCDAEEPPVQELFARVDEDQTVAVSEPSLSYCSSSPCANAEFQAASEDGSKVFFTSTQREEVPGVTDTTNNLYEAELGEVGGVWVRKSVVQVSAGDTSGGGAQVQGVSAMTEDGSHVYFVAEGVLTSAPGAAVEPATGLPQHAAAGADNLYLYERDAAHPTGRIVFIAQLSPADSQEWTRGPGREGLGASPSFIDATRNGDFLVFASRSDLTSDDTTTNGRDQLFEYDALSGTLVRVSIGQNGFDDNGNNPLREGAALLASEGQSLSEDGSYVFFRSADGLTPQALNHQVARVSEGEPVYAVNVYEYHDGNVYLISDGRDTSAHAEESLVSLVGTDASGADVFFTTSDQLVAQDTDTAPDLYDARIDGGFPAPVSLLPACAGDDCQGKLSPTPVLLSPGSEFQAGGNPPLAEASAAAKAGAKPKPKAKAVVGKCRGSSARKHGKCKSKAKRSARGRK